MNNIARITQLEHDLMTAVKKRDMETLELLLGDDFTLTTGRPGREVRSREDWLVVTQREYVMNHYDFEELEVQDYGTCAIVRSRYRQLARMGDQPRNTTYRMTDVWIRTRTGWQLQARHAQPVEGD